MIGKKQMEILALKCIISEIKYPRQGVNSRIKMTEERVSEFENRSMVFLKY